MYGVTYSKEGMEEFKEIVRRARGVYGIFVSPNEKAIFFTAAFIPELLDFRILFERIRGLVKTESNSNHILYAAGEPVLMGWVLSSDSWLWAKK